MNTNRPNFEALYKVAYRKHHELLNEIEDLLNHWDEEDEKCMASTGSDVIGMLRMIHEKYATSDFN